MLNAGIRHFEIEEPHVEIDVVSRDHAAFENVDQFTDNVLKTRCVRDVLIRDTVNLSCSDSSMWIYKCVQNESRLLAGVYTDNGDFDYTICTWCKACGLEIDYCDRSFVYRLSSDSG